jgi:hypothetical protein
MAKHFNEELHDDECIMSAVRLVPQLVALMVIEFNIQQHWIHYLKFVVIEELVH